MNGSQSFFLCRFVFDWACFVLSLRDGASTGCFLLVIAFLVSILESSGFDG